MNHLSTLYFPFFFAPISTESTYSAASNPGLVAYDSILQCECLFRPTPFLWPADNPMQAEQCSHSGLTSNKFCRTCHVGGTQEFKRSDEGYLSLFKVCRHLILSILLFMYCRQVNFEIQPGRSKQFTISSCAPCNPVQKRHWKISFVMLESEIRFLSHSSTLLFIYQLHCGMTNSKWNMLACKDYCQRSSRSSNRWVPFTIRY